MRIRKPDDFHVHLREGDSGKDVVMATAAQFARALVMPNLKPPVRTATDAVRYRKWIMSALPQGADFEPLMSLYLTDNTTPEIIAEAVAADVKACKLYPAGATTNSDAGVTDISKLDDVLDAMATLEIPLLLHGEVTTSAIDIFDREEVFLTEILAPLVRRHPRLNIVLEHITTKAASEFVLQGPDNLAATITAHHLLISRNAMLAGGIRPHLYCLPILKRERDRVALVEVATSGSPKFFLGTDSAPHAVHAKESACGCAGCFTALTAMELYAEVFEAVDKLDRLEDFSSRFGAEFYGLPLNQSDVWLEKRPQLVPKRAPFGGAEVRPFRAGEKLAWSLITDELSR